MSQKIATVLGATGQQGKGVIAGLSQLPGWRIRGITRNPTSESARALASTGVEVLQGDVNDEASLRAAFEGSSLIFAVTNFFENFDSLGPDKCLEREVAQGKKIARAAEATKGLEHFIWSSMFRSRDVSGGTIVCPHFESKNLVEDYIRTKPSLLAKTTVLLVGWYESNLQAGPMKPFPIDTAGKYGFIASVPGTTPVPVIGNVERNLGVFIKAIVEQPLKTREGTVVLATYQEHEFGEIVRAWAEAHGKEAVYIQTGADAFEMLWPGWGTELHLNMKLFQEFPKSYGDVAGLTVLRSADLGIRQEAFIKLEDSLKNV